MTCPRHDDLSAYADDMVQPAERVRMRQHLAGCPACQHRLDAITTLGQSLRALPSPPLGVDLAYGERTRGFQLHFSLAIPF